MNFSARTPRRVSKYVFALLSLLVALVSILYLTPKSSSQTTITVSSTAKQTGVKRFGINLANQDFYDSGMMLRNVIFRNPGFEGQTWTTILVCKTVTTTSCQDSNQYSTWPANYMQNASYQFMTGAAAGETGTVTSQDPANYSAGTGVTLHYSAPATQPASGDYIQVRTTIPGDAAGGWFIQNQNGAILSTDSTPADQAPGTTGTQCLEVIGPNSGQSVTVSQLFDTSGVRSFIQLNGAYTISFKARSTGGSPNINVQVMRLENPTQVVYLNQNVTLTSQWATYSYTFNTNETGSASGAVEAAFNFNGNSLLLDDVQMSPNTNIYGTAFRDEVVSTLISLKPGVLRYMDSAQGMGTSFDNMVKDQYGRQRAGWSQGTEIDTIPVGLYDFLKLCQAVGAEPWWTMPTAMNQSELQHVMEYMAGPSTSPYGAIRAAQGQSAPWTTVFPVIHLELGNEVWNGGSFSGETINSPDRFGQWANSVFSAAKATSYYTSNSSKFDFVIGSIEVNEFWTQYELDNCPACDTLAVAAYMFGTFGDYSSTEAIFGPMMAYPQWLDGPATTGNNNHMYLQTQVAAGINVADANGTKNPAAVAIYETNLGTNNGIAPQATVSSTVPSVGAGIATANHMLMMLRDLGVKTQNMFALSEYTNAFANSLSPSNGETTPLWGTVVDMGVTNLRRPQFVAEELTNSAILPTMLTTTQSGANPTWNQPLSLNDNVQLNNVQYIQSYAFTDGTNKTVIVFNLHRTSALTVNFAGANAPTGNLLVRQLTSANITDTNEASSKVNVTNSSINNATTATSYSLPPFSMTVFLWPDATLPASSTSLTASPETVSPGQSVTLSAIVTTSGTTTPTGTVTFLDGSTVVGTGALDSSGVGSYSTTSLANGSHAITASYGGSSTVASSTSSVVTVTVSSVVVGTTTTLTASPSSTTAGNVVTLSAHVVPQSGTGVPTGTVTFVNSGVTLGTGSLNSSGVASFSTSTLSTGSLRIWATYGGDAKDTGSTSSAIGVTIAPASTAAGVIPNGIYTLTNQLTTTYLDDPGGSTAPSIQIIQWPLTGGTNQDWVFTSNGKGYYTIQSLASGLFLTNPNASTVPGIPLVQMAATNNDWQLWSLVPSGANYSIENKGSGLVLDYGWVAGIDLWSPDGGANQEWALTATTNATGGAIIPNGAYTIKNGYSAEVLDDPRFSTVAGVQLIQNPEDGGLNQQWQFTSAGNGYFTIQNIYSGQFLTSPNSSTTPGIPLVQEPATNDGWQLWLLVPADGNYLLQNKSSGLIVEYPFNTESIIMWKQDGGANQQWAINP